MIQTLPLHRCSHHSGISCCKAQTLLTQFCARASLGAHCECTAVSCTSRIQSLQVFYNQCFPKLSSYLRCKETVGTPCVLYCCCWYRKLDQPERALGVLKPAL